MAAFMAHAPMLALCAAVILVVAIYDAGSRAEDRRAAILAEHRARAGTEQQDTAAITAQADAEGWTEPTEGERAA